MVGPTFWASQIIDSHVLYEVERRLVPVWRNVVVGFLFYQLRAAQPELSRVRRIDSHSFLLRKFTS